MLRVILGVVLAVLAAEAAGAQAPDLWRVVSDRKFATVIAYDTTRVKKLPHGRAEVWERFTLHPVRVDPDGTVGAVVLHLVVDCAAQQTAIRSAARYTPSGALITQTATFSTGDNDFSSETPGSVEESALHGICTALGL